MPQLLKLKTFRDRRGALTVLQDDVPFTIRRVYYIYEADDQTRGGHRHHKSAQLLIALNGRCEIYVHDGQREHAFALESPDSGLLLHPRDWHTMKFAAGAILLCLASELYDVADYIDEPYPAP